MTDLLFAERPVVDQPESAPQTRAATPQAYKDAVVRLPAGVSIIACEGEDGPHGRLVGSVTSLSADPPRLLVCVGKGSVTHDRLLAAPHVSISVLAEDDLRETEVFSRSDLRHERFEDDRWTRQDGHPPIYRAALATFVADVQDRIDFDSHSMLILSVREAAHRSGRPMVSFARGLHGLGDTALS